MRPLYFLAVAVIATPQSAQQLLPPSADVSLTTPSGTITGSFNTLGSRATSVRDDFNRANSINLGSDWAEMVGDVEILGDLCANIGTGNSWMLRNTAGATHVSAKVEFDIGLNLVNHLRSTVGTVYGLGSAVQGG